MLSDGGIFSSDAHGCALSVMKLTASFNQILLEIKTYHRFESVAICKIARTRINAGQRQTFSIPGSISYFLTVPEIVF